jgi:hypothetical protein
MRVLYINNNGGGFANYVDAEANSTVGEFFAKHMPDQKPEDYLIRVNRQPAAADQVLQESDRISITATKIAGA